MSSAPRLFPSAIGFLFPTCASTFPVRCVGVGVAPPNAARSRVITRLEGTRRCNAMSLKSRLQSGATLFKGVLLTMLAVATLSAGLAAGIHAQNNSSALGKLSSFDELAVRQATQAVLDGRQTFRFDTF